MRTDFFISKDVLSDVRDVFNLISSDPKGFDERKLEAKACLLDSEWKSYKDIYLALYVLNQSKEKNWSAKSVFSEASVNLHALLDLDLSDDTDELHAPNELAVHDIIRFRSRVLELLPAGTRLTQVGVGCTLLGFSIPLADAYPPSLEGVEEFRQDISRQLIDNGWTRLARLFQVADYHLS